MVQEKKYTALYRSGIVLWETIDGHLSHISDLQDKSKLKIIKLNYLRGLKKHKQLYE